MTDPGQFGSNKPSAPSGMKPGTKPETKHGPLDCAAVESWLAEAAEGNLPPTVAEQIREHVAGCPGCQEKLERTRRGREWLLVLKLESILPPAGMIAKILAATSLKAEGAAEDSGLFSSRMPWDLAGSGHPVSPLSDSDGPLHPDTTGRGTGQNFEGSASAEYPGKESGVGFDGSSTPAWQRNSVVVLRRTLLDPRLALVAAMAFFSISLTLNLLGVRLTDMRASDLRPQNISRALTRQYADANARVVRYYENLRIVYEVESRVQQLRRAAQTSPAPEQTSSRPRKRSSNSNHDSINDQTESHGAGVAANPETHGGKRTVTPQAVPDPLPVMTGPRLDAAFRPVPQGVRCAPSMICFSMYFSTRERRLA